MSEDLNERLEMINDFVTESREMLDNIEPQIIQMEKDALDSDGMNHEIVNSLFCLFHSIKGMSSFLDLQLVMKVTHEAETLLDIYRKGQLTLESEHIDILNQTCDFIRCLLDSIEQNLNDVGFEEQAEVIVGEIRHISDRFRMSSPAGNISQDQELQLKISPEMVKRFAEEALETFAEAETALLALEHQPGNDGLIEQAFRALHSFKGNAGFFGYLDFEQVSHKAENVLNEIRDGSDRATAETVSVLLTVIDALREGLQRLDAAEDVALPGKVMLIEKLDGVNIKKESVLPQNQDHDSGNVLKEEVVKKPLSGTQQAVRVDIEKLDSLLDLVGELVIAEAMVSHNPDLQGLQLDRFDKAVLQLSKITRDIQDVTMSLRMIPLAGTFNKMVRLVRDLALKENKKVNLQIIGEETEVDKTIIEQISDPLVHLIRNAIDHGLETPEERQQAGKPGTGQLTIEAKHSTGEVWIIIRDDGRGLNREKILQKALERGLIRDGTREIKDEEVWKLILEPGLSTAAQITSISGRGVGMDVVRRNIENLRGRIEIKSRAGEGTLFAVRIPLTLAIIDGMVVRVGNNRYTIPIISIKESFQPKSSQITCTPDGLEVVKIRNEIFPVLRLHELYRVQSDYHALTAGILILVESEERKCCLFVDDLIGQQQIVIKGLSNILGKIRGVSGCAILGDGEVSMILDVANLINSAEELLGITDNTKKNEIAN